MIRLITEQGELILGRANVNLKGKSPLLHRNYMPAVRNLPFQVPALDHNRKVLGFPDDPLKDGLPAELPCQVLLHDTLYLSATLQIMEANDRYIELRVLDPLADFGRQYGDKSIRELDMGTVSYGSQVASTTFEFKSTVPGVVYTIYLNDNQYDYTVQSGDSLVTISTYFATTINIDFPGYCSISGGLQQFLTIAQPTTTDPFKLGWAPISSSTIWDIVVLADIIAIRLDDYQEWVQEVVSNPGDYSYCFPMLYLPNLYGNDQPNTTYLGYANQWSGYAHVNNTYNGDDQWPYACCPCVYLKDVLVKMMEVAGYTLGVENDFASSREWDKIYLVNQYSIDDVEASWDDVSDYIYCNVFQNQFELNKCLPEIKWSKVLAGIRVLLQADFDWDHTQKTVTLRSATSIFSTVEEINWTDKVLASWKQQFEYSKGFTFVHDKDAQDEAQEIFSSQIEDYVHGLGEDSIENPLTPVMNAPPGGKFRDYRGTPISMREGYSDFFDRGYGTWPAAVGIYRGLLGGSNDFPLGRSDDMDRFEIPISNTISLQWGGNQGVINSLYAKWLTLQDSLRKMECYIDANQVPGSDLTFRTPIRAKGTLWLMGEYTLVLPAKSKQKVVLYRIVY